MTQYVRLPIQFPIVFTHFSRNSLIHPHQHICQTDVKTDKCSMSRYNRQVYFTKDHLLLDIELLRSLYFIKISSSPCIYCSFFSIANQRASSLRLRILGTWNFPILLTSYITVEFHTGQSNNNRL